ncbi:hypothetical protein [Flavobacterium sp.]|uniref:hypothetical protein n=1 Tax=Flavobacterium sp. TaxID=239 RepID=UPI0040345573
MLKDELAAKFDNRIELETAQNWAKKWREGKEGYIFHSQVKGFLIPIEGLKHIFDSGAEAARAYIGVDDNGEAKLMFVGTTYNHQMQTHDDMLPKSAQPGFIYDFTLPCPRACGYNSPLNDLEL